VVLVTHKLDEVARVADEVTVLRGGRTVASWSDEVTAGRDRAGDGGRASRRRDRRAALPAAGAAVGLAVRASPCRGPRGGGAVEVSLEVRAGEVVGVAGVEGNGQRELGLAIAGLDADRARAR
jgi:ABC-type uncharacterized transport system ATPase subunit